MCEGKENRCGTCRNYAELAEPFHYEKTGYPDGVTVFGFCAKDVNRLRSFYPVYLPDGGVCKDYRKKRNQRSQAACNQNQEEAK